MIALHVEVPYASFRKSYARSFAETYPFPPPATIYGMLLSLVGEHLRTRHSRVSLAFAYARQPKIATTLRKLSRYKYGVSSKQSTLGNAPDFVETLCDIDLICWIDSSTESHNHQVLESRILEALESPENINRIGVLSLGLSDDAVDSISLMNDVARQWYWLTPCNNGQIELPVWVDHVGAFYTRWQRYNFDDFPSLITSQPSSDKFVPILDPR